MSIYKASLENNSTCVVYLGKQGKENDKIVKFLLTLGPCGRLHSTKWLK